MTRLLLALVAIAVLALSAGLSRGHAVVRGAQPYAIQSLAARPAAAALDLVPPDRPLVAPRPAPAGDDAPQPALLAYLALVLIGGAVAVGRVLRAAQREEM